MKKDFSKNETLQLLVAYAGGFTLPRERTWQLLDKQNNELPLRNNEAFTLDRLEGVQGFSPRVILWRHNPQRTS